MGCNEANWDKRSKDPFVNATDRTAPLPRVSGGRFPLPLLSPGDAAGKRRCFMFRNLLPGQRAPSLCDGFASRTVFSPSSAYALTQRGGERGGERGTRTTRLQHSLWLLHREGVGAAFPGFPQEKGLLTQSREQDHCRQSTVALQGTAEPLVSQWAMNCSQSRVASRSRAPWGRPLTELLPSRTHSERSWGTGPEGLLRASPAGSSRPGTLRPVTVLAL